MLTKNKQNWRILKLVLIFLSIIVILPSVMAVASFAVTSFSCTPSEVAINDVFSCTAQVRNNGDLAGSVDVITLYSDSNDWLENSNYPQGSGTSVDPSQSIEVTFSGLRSVKSGNNGFSKIMLDDVEDKYVLDNNVKVNVINVVVTVSDSASSAASGASFDSTASVTAGGNIDVSLTFTVNSGGCSIGSQDNPKTISDMSDGNVQSRTWSVTQGSSGDCSYIVNAAATGSGGIATKSDSSSSTVTCSDCDDSGDGSSSSGSGGGDIGSGTTYVLGDLTSTKTVEVKDTENVKFNISGVGHVLTLRNHTETTATFTIRSETQTITLSLGDEKKIDLNSDGISEISVKLKTINIISNKVTLVLTPIAEPMPVGEDGVTGGEEGAESGKEGRLAEAQASLTWLWILIIIIVVIAVIFITLKKKNKKLIFRKIYK